MRSLFRTILATSVLASLLVAAGASSVLANTTGPASDVFPIDEAYCFQDITLEYCFDFEGTVRYTSTPGGLGMVAIQERQDVVIYENDVVVGSYRTTSFDQMQMSDDGRYTVQSVGHTKSIDGDTTCVSTVVLRIADYEVVVDHATLPVCH